MRASVCVLLLVLGCQHSIPDNNQNSTGQLDRDKPKLESSMSPIVITNYTDLSKHVGKIVTLKGTQTRTKIPTVVGVPVAGDDAYADQIVTVTGRLNSHEVTDEDVKKFDEAQSRSAFAAARPSVGTQYSIIDPETGKIAKTSRLNNVSDQIDRGTQSQPTLPK